MAVILNCQASKCKAYSGAAALQPRDLLGEGSRLGFPWEIPQKKIINRT